LGRTGAQVGRTGAQVGRTTGDPGRRTTGRTASVLAAVGRGAEHLVPPHDHANDQRQQRQRCQRDRRVDQAQVAGHGACDQQAHRNRSGGHDCAEPGHLEAPLVVNRNEP